MAQPGLVLFSLIRRHGRLVRPCFGFRRATGGQAARGTTSCSPRRAVGVRPGAALEVEMAGLEPAFSTVRGWRALQLPHIPISAAISTTALLASCDRSCFFFAQSGRWDLNPRSQPPQGCDHAAGALNQGHRAHRSARDLPPVDEGPLEALPLVVGSKQVDVPVDAREVRQLFGNDDALHSPLLGEVDVLPVTTAAAARRCPRTRRGSASCATCR